MLLSCASLGTSKPAHCVEKVEWFNYADVVRSKREIHEPDSNGVPTKHVDYALRTSYLEARCKGINALRDE